jgi:hypothetical protein
MAKKKKTKASQRNAAGPARPSARRGGGGTTRSGKVTTNVKASATEGLPHAEFLGEIRRFAEGLQTSVKQASWFYWDFMADTGQWPLTKKGQTQFVNRARAAAVRFRELHMELAGLHTNCPEDDRCISLITTLSDGCLGGALCHVADELDRIASRAERPLTADERDLMLEDLQAFDRALESLQTAAEWIQQEVRAVRERPKPPGTERAPLPAVIEELLISSEKGARNCMEAIGKYPDLQRSDQHSQLEYLGILQEARKTLDTDAKHFADTLRGFSKDSKQIAELGEEKEVLSFLTMREDVLKRVAARRTVSIRLLGDLVQRIKERLSYDTASETCSTIERIQFNLDRFQYRLKQQKDLLEVLERQAANERVAATPRMSDLPEWDAIVRAVEGDGSRLAGLDILVAAFLDETWVEEDAPSFLEMTQEDLRRQLAKLYPERWSAEKSLKTWVARHLVIAQEFGIVGPIEPPKGTSRRVGYRYRLTDAAVKKYGKHVAAIRPTEPRPS